MKLLSIVLASNGAGFVAGIAATVLALGFLLMRDEPKIPTNAYPDSAVIRQKLQRVDME
jgi:hypothetical protein